MPNHFPQAFTSFARKLTARLPTLGVLITGQMLSSVAVATAAAPMSYECAPEGDVYYVVDLIQQGNSMAAAIGPRSEYIRKPENEIARQVPAASGTLFESRNYSFHTKGNQGTLTFRAYPNDRPVPCRATAMRQTHSTGAVGGAETVYGSATARSLGGKLRNGPGTNFSPTGSLPEGSPVTVIANTGVRFDGYDWFEIRHAGGSAFQWGGIMCWDGAPLTGMYGDCRSVMMNSPRRVQQAGSSGGWMAFATGSNGKFGHGAGATRDEAISYAMSYCGDASCGIRDVTRERCHAFASGYTGVWFGAGDTQARAESFAIDFCTRAEAGCVLKYSYCR